MGFKTFATHYNTIALNDPSAPLKIARARTLTPSRGAREDMMAQIGLRRGNHHLLKGCIVTIDAPSDKVTAAKIGITVYDSFEDPAGGYVGVQTKRPTGMLWSDREDIAWHGFGIARVFVQAIRFEEGRVWKADLKKVAVMMIVEGCSSTSKGLMVKRLKALPKGAMRL